MILLAWSLFSLLVRARSFPQTEKDSNGVEIEKTPLHMTCVPSFVHCTLVETLAFPTAIRCSKYANRMLSKIYTTYSYWSLARAATVHLHVRLVVDWSSRRALYQSLDRPTWGLIAFYLLSCFLGYWSLLWYYWTTIFINYCMGRGEAGHSNIHRKYHLDSN